MEKRYQAFVSSTYTDLREERQGVIETLLKMGCIPAGMDLFPAQDEKQWPFIKRVIDDCDYYLLIIGGRYGTLTADGVSYTEKEFDYAVARELKPIAFLHGEPDTIPVIKSDIKTGLRKKLAAFRKKVCTDRLVQFWRTADELSALVSLSLQKTIEEFPRGGWVRASSFASEQSLFEILRLAPRLAEDAAMVQKIYRERNGISPAAWPGEQERLLAVAERADAPLQARLIACRLLGKPLQAQRIASGELARTAALTAESFLQSGKPGDLMHAVGLADQAVGFLPTDVPPTERWQIERSRLEIHKEWKATEELLDDATRSFHRLESAKPDETEAEVEALIVVAAIQHRLDHFAQCREAAARARALGHKLAADDPRMLRALNLEGMGYWGECLYVDAIRTFREILARGSAAPGSDLEKIRSQHNLAGACYGNGDYEKADPLFRDTLDASERILGRGNRQLRMLAVIYVEMLSQLGQREIALDAAKRYGLDRSLADDGSGDAAQSLRNRTPELIYHDALLGYRSRDSSLPPTPLPAVDLDALESIQRAILAEREQASASLVDQAWSHYALARVLFALGRLDGARSHAEKARTFFQRIEPPAGRAHRRSTHFCAELAAVDKAPRGRGRKRVGS